ncbi:glucan 1,6-alpha-glucosidase [Marinobacterium nitratireducens]|uniref:Glucan 1,6-alpha-glucosidase n=1 Tax=Marinobacterium nitratireducens TaxID=518897 RepID=A0A917ZL41_9GAMM|nr:alpha-glucosidase [Marinobacterium nitratireducens]GGO85517.1 glucan 1,6-alpha-glucosidase [Marinobacterium nitratireducens]
MSTPQDSWWKSATAYQIYPRSFCDSNGDGIGDIPGIISKLDYLAELGIGFIWLSPVYRSPMADNGYDISDYQDIAPEFGTREDFDRLLAGARERGIGIVMDLVVNHSSDEHPWFIESRSSRDAGKRDFYVWRDPADDGGPPNDLQSFFGGPAWTLDENTGQYYLHLFDRKQPDLNWENPAMRREIWKMINWWLDRGVAGFRMDVIDLIAKEIDRGIIADGPRLHEYLQEMHRETLAGRDIVTVGEAWSANTENALLYSGQARNELSMVFQFEHVTQQWDGKLGKWKPRPFDLAALKRVMNKWQLALADDGWNSLFWGNHDLPRAVSKYGDDKRWRVESAKMLATVLHLMKGTPYIYQGEEFGMTNAAFSRIDQFKDLETLNFYDLQTAAGVAPEDFIAGANENSRDNARTPVQWSSARQAGFTTGTPWIDINPNHSEINAAEALQDPQSIFTHYRCLAKLRRELPVIVHGDYQPWLEEHPQVFAYSRHLDDQTLTVVANFGDRELQLEVPEAMRAEGRGLIANYEDRNVIGARLSLQPYEAFAILS